MCREPGCQRRTHPESPYCDDHLRLAVMAPYRTVQETEHGARTLPPVPMLRLFDRPNTGFPARLGRPATE